MDFCEHCGAELSPVSAQLNACEACGRAIDAEESCLMCGGFIERDDEWWEDSLCVACAELVGRP
jgi:hypothetical protein